ncbi:hypothetical protein [Chitinophaga sp. 212800010-3]|uniref:glucuronyl esterase domain-containing protein n=1 Tax=unclassified Chitinophaga TaxID=2619133 RepID=UPI002DEC049E|nr:Acetylxylan esterase [Chitinophaga sp. 212800010-3]
MSLRNISFVLLIFSCFHVSAQDFRQSNTDESKVPPYTLPDVLKMPNGKQVQTAAAWQKIQRPYIYHLFEENVYGKFPRVPVRLSSKLVSTDKHALNGKAIRKLVDIYFNNDTSAVIHLLMYLPHNARPVPVFLGMNFHGNQSVYNDPAVPVTSKYSINGAGIVNDHATAASRGSQSQQWQVDTLLAHGFGLVTFFYGDVEEDYPEGWQHGFRSKLATALKTAPEEWSAIGAWAWALSKVMDYLQQEPLINTKQVCVIGHSRLGKTALWAGASDPRFAIVYSNESGEGGAALARRWYGETLPLINDRFPHWFCAKYKQYNEHVSDLPVDQHMLLAMMAPRPLYVASAEADKWSDPRGEFLSAWNAGVVYRLFGKKGIGSEQYPAVHEPVGEWVRYHVRAGKHDVTEYDWREFLWFAERVYKIR